MHYANLSFQLQLSLSSKHIFHLTCVHYLRSGQLLYNNNVLTIATKAVSHLNISRSYPVSLTNMPLPNMDTTRLTVDSPSRYGNNTYLYHKSIDMLSPD